MSALPDIDLSAIPEDQRDAVAALLHETVSMKEVVKHLEHLVAELNHVVHGKKLFCDNRDVRSATSILTGEPRA